MAIARHLQLLRSDVNLWNTWRENNPKEPIDLTEAYLARARLAGANLRGTDLRHTELEGANLRQADLIGANLRGANLHQADLIGANLTDANLTDANLAGARLDGAELQHACFTDANLHGAGLVRARISGANLVRADLTSADLTGARFQGANLTGADLASSNLAGAVFAGALIGWTKFSNVDLRGALGLKDVRHIGPSTIGIDTLYRSAGKIPEAFLRGGGVPDVFIDHVASLVGAVQPIRFYSCFISYSSKDQSFAERLHADLRAKHVRCWFASEDLKIGDRFRDEIERSIRLHDRLLLVLSEHSITSSWVRTEVETAFEREAREHKTVLFPIRLDDEAMSCEMAWAADIRRTRQIGDFTKWKSHDEYKRGFDRLLRDLNVAGEPTTT